MDERSDGGGEKMEEIMLPGFRFHPTDEELVGFYLKRKIQQRPLTIELIKQLDIYKFDPWDLPKLATTGEKEWYFYCPRDRKYRNSARPNRVTGAGFWKATGTDRPIYSSEGSKCIGLKKSLVFYKGRAAKGVKTDWMMHEFRLPSLADSSAPKRFLDKTIPANDSWAICRIFKKTNSTAQRALSQSWVSPSPRTTTSTDQNNMPSSYTTKPNVTHILDPFSSYTNKSNINPILASPYHIQHHPHSTISNGLDLSSSTFMFSPLDQPSLSSAPPRCSDVSTMLLNMSSSLLGDQYGRQGHESNIDHQFGAQDHNNNGFVSLMSSLVPQQHEEHHHEMHDHGSSEEINDGMMMMRRNNHGDEQQWIGFPMNTLPLVSGNEAWKSSLVWEASLCPSEMSTTKCYT